MDFSNEIVEVTALPKFESITLKPIQKSFLKIMFFNIFILFLFFGIGLFVIAYLNSEVFNHSFFVIFLVLYFLLFGIALFLSYLNFKNKGYAFRKHDAVYKSGVIAITTTIVPYNRIQHVALHQGVLSRYFGLASLELFTAGGNASDLEIKGLTLDEAQQYKLWITQQMDDGKVTNQMEENNANQKNDLENGGA